MDQGAGDLPGGIVTFFFSDVEGSTRLATAQGERFAETLERHRRVVRDALAARGGVEVSTAGDSFFAVFPDPAEAAAAAVAIEVGLREATLAQGDHPLRVRIGLHTGQAVRVGRDYVGLDVHIASRVSDAGHGGQILLSDATHQAIREQLAPGWSVIDLGRHRLKDVGPQRIWQLEGPGEPDGRDGPAHRFPALRSLEAHPSNLPLARSPLVDREAEQAELAALIGRASVVTVTGAGGIGKSRVALEVARSLVAGFPDGVFYLDLVGVPDAPAVAEALLDLMGARPSVDADARTALLDRLKSRDLLLVLDTADRVADLPALIASIAATCPRIRVLLTSRSSLHLAAEVEIALLPLGQEPAVELFRARAESVRPLTLDDPGSAAAVARLVARLDGIPLAIELAAARTKLFTPAALLDRLERRLPSLGQGALDVPSRQRTLHDTISWSCELLRPAEQAAFRELGVFAGSVDLEAVEAVVAPLEGEDAVTLLEALIDRSLVVAEVAGGAETRFRLLGPIREFAADALKASPDADRVRERHARHWVAFASDRLQDQAHPGPSTIRAIEASEPDIRAALDWSLGTADGRSEIALELVGHMGRYWWIRGRVAEGLRWVERALAAAAADDPSATEARFADSSSVRRLERGLFWAGVLLDDTGRSAEAMARLEACLAVQRRLDDDFGAARTLNSLGVVARSLGDLERAQRLLEESIERKRAVGDRAGVAVTLSNLGLVASDRRMFDEAVRYLSEALEIDEGLGGGSLIVSHANLGALLTRTGRLTEGVTHLRLALPGIEELGDPLLVIEILTSLGRVELGASDEVAAVRAARLLFAAEAVRERDAVTMAPSERSEVEELLAQVSTRLSPAQAGLLRAEAGAIDIAAALTLAREAMERL
jgi:predicted ATPase/class 3 adenylate cyclase